MGATAQSAFTRKASGLVRNMSLLDAAMFGLLKFWQQFSGGKFEV